REHRGGGDGPRSHCGAGECRARRASGRGGGGTCVAGPLRKGRAGRAARYEARGSGRGSRAGTDKQIAQIGRSLAKRGADFEHHVVLVELREDGGNFPLAVGVVERLVDGGWRNSQPRGGVAVKYQLGAQTL